ncbi:glucosaminidase domain-containing protein [Candidatus Saccharibacteria bacterium]|nr:glucosaminidase domain-containing protein [Candidatus Saccharibacteria bacterium]
MKRWSFLRSKIALAGVLALSFGLSLPVFALSSSELEIFSQNGILFYDPSSQNCNIAIGSYDGNASAGLSDAQAAFVDTYHDIAERLSIEYGIPWETVIAQGILESAAGTSNFAVNRNNFFGIGAYDSNPDNAFSYETPEEGWRGYYENIRKTATYRAHGVFSGDTVTDPYAYAQAIKNAGYATDPNYVSKLNNLISAIENRARGKNWSSSAELATLHPEMLENANKNAAGEGGAVAPVVSGSCILSGNGDINATALELSWPDRSHAPTDPKVEYRNALAETGVNRLGDTCSMGGYSCDAFLATVMRFSGADTGFPCCGAAMQLNYLTSHGDLYEEIPNIGNTSNIQAGDIRANGRHVEVVVQFDDGTFGIASASHCDRTGDHATGYYVDSSYRIFRRK